jgi:hypothetical protein
MSGVHFVRDVGSVPTEIYLKRGQTYGDTVFVMIAGNPGLVNFYEEFIDHLHDRLGGAYPIIGGRLFLFLY